MDPSWNLDVILGRNGALNPGHFASPRFERALRRANTLSGSARYEAYSHVDADVARIEAPTAVFAVKNTGYFFSARVGCIAANFYGWDIAAACIKRRPA
jgi:hypothetical protein